MTFLAKVVNFQLLKLLNRSLSIFLPVSLSVSLYPLFPFHKGKDTTAIPQPSVHHVVYVFRIFFRFHKCRNNFHSSKNLRTNKFFPQNMCFFIFLLPWRKWVAGFSLK